MPLSPASEISNGLAPSMHVDTVQTIFTRRELLKSHGESTSHISATLVILRYFVHFSAMLVIQ